MTDMQVPLEDLAHVPVYTSAGRLANMRAHPGRREIPIRLRRQGNGLWQLVDGCNRLAVARENGESHIRAVNDAGRHS